LCLQFIEKFLSSIVHDLKKFVNLSFLINTIDVKQHKAKERAAVKGIFLF
jgi:hypothetical protein